MTEFPKFVEFHEEGPREGFQAEKKIYPLNQRLELIHALGDTGLREIQVASFVSPKYVPQMVDSAELFRMINKVHGVRYTTLWLNKKGFEQASSTPGVDIDGKLLLYTSEAFCQKNNGCSIAEFNEKQFGWLDSYAEAGIEVGPVYLLTAFGCNLQGDVPVESLTDSIRFLMDLCQQRSLALPTVFLADTMGWANPLEVKRRLGAIKLLLPESRLGLHLHDTRGMGAANFYAGLEMGVDLFDSSIAGLGGCPFGAQKDMRAAGNICTEDMVLMCHEMGIETGIDLDALLEAAKLAENIIGRPLTGKTMHSGSLNSFRSAGKHEGNFETNP